MDLSTAYHEAGHIAVAIHYGFETDHATIEANQGEDLLGRVVSPSLLMYKYPNRWAFYRAVKEAIIARYAGYEAECLVHPDADERQSQGDFNAAWSLPREHNIPIRDCSFIGDDAYDRYLERRRREARRLVRRLQTAIDALAQALLRKKSLSGKEAKRVFTRACPP